MKNACLNFSCFKRCVLACLSVFVITHAGIAEDFRIDIPNLPTNARGLELTRIPEGAFTIGSPESDDYRSDTEGPMKDISFHEDFLIGKYEVTNAQFAEFLKQKGNYIRVAGKYEWYFDENDPDLPLKLVDGVWQVIEGYENYPVVEVSWWGAREFCAWLNEIYSNNPYQTITFRLPSEAEWEYACRADTTTRYYWGDDLNYSLIGEYAWYNGNSMERPHEVGSKKPNGLGLFDRSGNIWEWCQDIYGDYNSYSQNDPVGAESGSYRVIRGGGWSYIATGCRSSFRYKYDQNGKSTVVGFRIVK